VLFLEQGRGEDAGESRLKTQFLGRKTVVSAFANLRLHFAAFLLDYLVIAIYIVVLIAVSVLLGLGPLRQTFQVQFANPTTSEISAFLLLVFPVILYFVFFESSSSRTMRCAGTLLLSRLVAHLAYGVDDLPDRLINLTEIFSLMEVCIIRVDTKERLSARTRGS